MKRTGTVAWFNERKGFGFVRDDESREDVFVHYEVIERRGFKTLNAGERVAFDYAPGPGGLKVAKVTLLS